MNKEDVLRKKKVVFDNTYYDKPEFNIIQPVNIRTCTGLHHLNITSI